MAETGLRPGATVGGYRIEGMAGRGGMGVVYRAIQVGLDRPVALKLLTPELAEDDAFRTRFQRESRLLAAIDHPNVITVHEAGEHEGRLFIAMRFVPGTDLAALLKSEGSLDPRRATGLLEQVAAALDAAHARGLVHRDVKPANVLIEERDGREHAYLTDFGLTKAIDSTAGLTATGQFMGTVDYIAPEQARGQRVDARTDVYSLGCVLYTVLTGDVPFERDSHVARIFAHINDPPPSLLEALPDAPPELDGVVQRALEKEPDRRFPSAGDLARAAVAAAAGDTPRLPERTVAAGEAAPAEPTGATARPDEASPAGPAPPSRRLRRRAAWALALAAVVAALAVGIALVAGGGSSDDDSDALTAVLEPHPVPLSGSPQHLAVAEGTTWVASVDGGSVTPIDASGTRGRPIAVGMNPAALAAGDGVVLVNVDDGSAIFRIDAEKRQRVGSPVPAQLQSDGDLAYGDGGFWVALATGEVGRIDPKTGRIVAIAPVPEPGSDGRLTVGAGAVWVVASTDSTERSFVFRIDAQSRRVTAKIDLGRKSYAPALAFGEGALWIPDNGNNVLVRVDPKTNRITHRTKVDYGLSDDIAVADGAVWVINHDPGRMIWFDPANGAVAQAAPVTTSEQSDLVVGLGSAWISRPEDGSVTRLEY